MTTLYTVKYADQDNMPHEEAFDTLGKAKSRATELRREGFSNQLDKVELKLINKKQLLCALFNRDGYEESREHVQTLTGVQRPKKAA